MPREEGLPEGREERPDRVSAEEVSEGEVSREENAGHISGVEYTIRTKEEPSSNRPFAHGVVDGMEEVAPESFERFLTQSSEQGRLQERKSALAKREATLQSEKEKRVEQETSIERKKQRLADLKAEEADREVRVERLDEQLRTYERQGRENNKRMEEDGEADGKGGHSTSGRAGTPGAEKPASNESAAKDSGTEETAPGETGPRETGTEGAPDRGSLAYALLYSVAGLIFVAGDVIMSREVVSRALRLKGDAEPWIFAVGLAMLAVLMKPAYDRLVEKPYWNGRRKAFRWTICIGAVVAALTLGVLGAFRADAFKTRQKVSHLQEKLNQGVKTGEMSPSEMADLQAQISTLEQSVAGSMLGFWSFVLSGVLFAAAGAVCLGIGLRHSRDWYHRSARPLLVKKGQVLLDWWRARRLRSRREEAGEALRECRSKRAELEAELKAEEKRCDLARPLSEIQEELTEVRRKKEAVQAERWVGAGHRRVEAYRNGYDTGSSLDITRSTRKLSGRENGQRRNGEKQETAATGVEDAGADSGETGTAGVSAKTGNGESGQDGPRPFLAVREAISEGQID